MIKENEFLKCYEEEKKYLIEWGKYISEYILKQLERENINVDKFLKINVTPRLKDNNSIIEKAFYRGKGYTDPINEITDKVGIRFVVLLVDHIKIIENIIEKNDEWTNSRDRDFEEEREKKPEFFQYQSVHYIIRNNIEINVNNTVIRQNTPCEVQIRTLLQHAYSELTHDTIYKPKQNVNPLVKRLVARSMAMIETTDCIFKEVNDTMISEKNTKSNNLLPKIKQEYSKFRVPDRNEKLEDLIIETYSDKIESISTEEFEKFIENNIEAIKNQIITKYDKQLLYRQSIIILIYFLVEKYPIYVKSVWPLTNDLIKPIYMLMGISFNN
nr:RelA/SpoT [Clostridium butyricum]